MRKHFDEELLQVKSEFITMASVVDKSLLQAITALEKNDPVLARDVIELEPKILDFERLIERRCMLILLYQQPVASDLRMVSAIMKMISELRHLSNQATEISELIITNHTKIHFGEVEELVEMGQKVRRMTYDAIHAFSVSDERLARQVVSQDDEVDNLFTNAKKMIVKGIKTDACKPGTGVDALMISKHMEKIGDYSVAMAAWTIYMITNESVETILASSTNSNV